MQGSAHLTQRNFSFSFKKKLQTQKILADVHEEIVVRLSNFVWNFI